MSILFDATTWTGAQHPELTVPIQVRNFFWFLKQIHMLLSEISRDASGLKAYGVPDGHPDSASGPINRRRALFFEHLSTRLVASQSSSV